MPWKIISSGWILPSVLIRCFNGTTGTKEECLHAILFSVILFSLLFFLMVTWSFICYYLYTYKVPSTHEDVGGLSSDDESSSQEHQDHAQHLPRCRSPPLPPVQSPYFTIHDDDEGKKETYIIYNGAVLIQNYTQCQHAVFVCCRFRLMKQVDSPPSFHVVMRITVIDV
jgi:hypothetical protein